MISTRNTLSGAAALFAAAALVAGAVSPAIAAPNDPDKAQTEAKPKAKVKEQRYCVQGPTTGTMLPKKECHTRAEWIARGFDPVKDK